MKRYYVLLMLSLILCTACKKEKDDQDICRTKSMSITGSYVGNYTEYYIYDKQNRLIKVEYSNGGVITIAYKGDVIETRISPSLVITSTLDNGRIVSENYSTGEEMSYEYDSEGYLTRQVIIGADDTQTITYTYRDGNPTAIARRLERYIMPETIVKYSNEPYQRLVNSSPYGIFEVNGFLTQYYGREPRNIPIEFNDKIYLPANVKKYERDAQGRIVSIEDSNALFKYDYSCD